MEATLPWCDVKEQDEYFVCNESTRRSARQISFPGLFMIAFVIFANVLQPSSAAEFGSLRLCPAGGRSFMMAWNLACEMKRKKRSVPDVKETVLGTASASASAAFVPLSPTSSSRDVVKKRTAPEGYRPATLTEIMKICCDVGCEVRDLLAYCDPFGPWNS